MIDYLESLFVQNREEEPEAGEGEARASPLSQEPEWRKVAHPEEETVKEMRLPDVGEQEVDFRRLTRPGEERPVEGARDGVELRRAEPARESERMERRLRRESRRYDCGFYRY